MDDNTEQIINRIVELRKMMDDMIINDDKAYCNTLKISQKLDQVIVVYHKMLIKNNKKHE